MIKRLLLLAGAVAGARALIKKRGDDAQVQQAVSKVGDVVERAKEAAPEPVRQAVDKAAETVQRAIPGQGGGGDESPERYQPPAEAGSQPPSEPGGAPTSTPPITTASSVASEPGDRLQTPEHELPGDAVMPDTSADDPLVREQEQAAAADAGSIGGNVDQLAADEPGFPEDPATRPVIEGSGDADETLEARDRELGGNRQTEA
jgi:hypothetical protein